MEYTVSTPFATINTHSNRGLRLLDLDVWLLRGLPERRCECGAFIDRRDDVTCARCQIKVGVIDGRAEIDKLRVLYGQSLIDAIEWSDDRAADEADFAATRIAGIGV